MDRLIEIWEKIHRYSKMKYFIMNAKNRLSGTPLTDFKS